MSSPQDPVPERRSASDRRQTPEDVAAGIDRSLSVSWKEGIAAQIMSGIFDYYLIPFALFLGAPTPQIGILVSLPHLLAAFSQFFVVRAVDWAGSRLRLLVLGTLIQAFFMLPIGFLVWKAFPGRVMILIALVSVFRVISGLIGPAWGSLVSDYLPEDRRGRYFGWRSQIIGLSGVVGISLWGAVLGLTSPFSPALGFAGLFLSAAFFRFVSCGLMRGMLDLPVHRSRESEFTFWQFIRRIRESNFVRYVLYVSSITFATQLASAYLSVHMLRDLRFDYVSYMFVQLASVIASLAAFRVWGHHADRFGNAKILKFTSFLIPLMPFMWIFVDHPLQLTLIEAFGGFVWAGFNLCATNFIYDAVMPSKRVRCLGYFNLINGCAIFCGASLGGVLADRLPPMMGYPLCTLFFISGVLRLAADLIFAKRFREVRLATEKVRSARLFVSVLGVRSLIGPNLEWEALPFVKRFIPRRGPRRGSGGPKASGASA